jgi:hypothetical protein
MLKNNLYPLLGLTQWKNSIPKKPQSIAQEVKLKVHQPFAYRAQRQLNVLAESRSKLYRL